MKNFKRILALVLAVMMVAACMVTTYAAETDDALKYDADAIVRLNKLGIFQGKSEGELKPEDKVTRAEMAQLTGRVITGKVASNYWESYINDTTFEDLDSASWAVGAIAYAYEQGIVIGKSAVRFDPMGNVTYQDALTMAVRSLGYTGLSYPNGFINKAMKLGLTDGIANLAYSDAANRGVVATILYNALYAEDSLFADNFNLTSGTYMLVATPTVVKHDECKIPGASINGYIGKALNENYVAFAPIGDDYKAVNKADKYVYALTSQISDDIDGNYAHKLGYAYTLTFENDKLTWGDECDSKTFVNYGDNREIGLEFIDYDHTPSKPEGQSDWFLNFGNQSYNLVDGYDADYTAPTSTHNLILYADFGAPSVMVNVYEQRFDEDRNIVNEKGEILLHYDEVLGYVREVMIGTKVTYVKATAAEIASALAKFENALDENLNASDYAIVESGDIMVDLDKLGLDKDYIAAADVNLRDVVISIANNYFCEITAMDYDNDGIYDAAIYTPYYLGYTGKIENSDKLAYNGNEFSLTGVTTADGKSQLLSGVHVNDYTFTGKISTPGAYGWYVYSYNRHTQTIDVKEKAKSVSGKVEWAVKGAVNAATNIYEDSEVKIGDTVYQVGGWNFHNLYGLNQVAGFDQSQRNAIAKAMDEKVTSTYYNGWNDVLEFGMTNACKGFKGYAIAGHLIHGVPLLTDAAKYGYVMFNAYQSEFAVENDQIVVDALVDTTGELKTIKINSVNSMEFNDIEFHIFCEYVNVFYAAAANKNPMISYFFDEGRLATHQATPLYKAVERAYIIDRLLKTTADIDGDGFAENYEEDGTKTLIYAVNGTNADGSYKLLTEKDPTGALKVNAKEIEFTFGISSEGLTLNSSNKVEAPIRTNANTVFTFVAQDGIFTYVGMPEDDYTLNLEGAKLYKADSTGIMVVNIDKDIDEIAIGDATWTEKVTDIVREDDAVRCAALYNKHVDTWAFREYIPYVSATFIDEEVYLVTEKTSNTKIGVDDDGVNYYTYANLYNLVDGKYEESVIFNADEVAVFEDVVFYENGSGKVGTNYGAIITRDREGNIKTILPDEYKTDGSRLFVLDNVEVGEYESKVTDNTKAVSHVTISGTKYAVNKVEFITVYQVTNVKGEVITNALGTPVVEVGDFSNIAKGAVVYYNYDADTGVLTGYAFN